MNILHKLIFHLHFQKLHLVISLSFSLGYVVVYNLPNLDELFSKTNGLETGVLIYKTYYIPFPYPGRNVMRPVYSYMDALYTLCSSLQLGCQKTSVRLKSLAIDTFHLLHHFHVIEIMWIDQIVYIGEFYVSQPLMPHDNISILCLFLWWSFVPTPRW